MYSDPEIASRGPSPMNSMNTSEFARKYLPGYNQPTISNNGEAYCETVKEKLARYRKERE